MDLGDGLAVDHAGYVVAAAALGPQTGLVVIPRNRPKKSFYRIPA
jgi:hypothetical protein